MLILSLSRRDQGMRQKEPALQMCKNKTKASVFNGKDLVFSSYFSTVVSYLKGKIQKRAVIINVYKGMELKSLFFDLVLSFITMIYQCWPVYGRTAGAVGSFSRMERIYWPLRQLRYTSRSLAPFLGRSLALNTRDLCVSLSFGWQLWAKHSYSYIYTFAILKR